VFLEALGFKEGQQDGERKGIEKDVAEQENNLLFSIPLPVRHCHTREKGDATY